MGLNLHEVKLIVYDLDGTIYDDTRHFEIYARLIQAYLPEAVQAAFWADYTATVAASHPALRVGTFYDVDRDLILRTNGSRVVGAAHWDGSEPPPIVIKQLYPGVIVPDHLTVMNVGDLWWVPVAISAHYGGEAANNNTAFLEVRAIMSEPTFTVKPIPGLKETILDLKGTVAQVLATNSPQPDSEAILSKVGLLGAFDRVFFRSNKPIGIKLIIDELAQAYDLPFTAILSIGDNYVNEIIPAKAMGCQTILIDPHKLSHIDEADLVVPTMSELIPILRRAHGLSS